MHEVAPALPGLGRDRPEPLVAPAIRVQLAALIAAGAISDSQAAHASLAVRAGDTVDAIGPLVKPYASAELIATTLGLLANLPGVPDGHRSTWTYQLPHADAAGDQETSVRFQIAAMTMMGTIGDEHAGLVALALATARLVDSAAPHAASAGLGKLIAAMGKVLSALPSHTIESQVAADLLTAWVRGSVLTPTQQTLIDETFPAGTRVFRYAPPAAHATPRDPSWLSEGAEIARVARAMGIQLMPWQRQVIDVATEYQVGEFGQRRYRYKRILITVPRQSGKTTLLGPVRMHRMLINANAELFSTAQTGKDAGKRMRALIQQVGASPLGAFFRPRYSNGSEGLTATSSGSQITRFAPRDGALHGETPIHVDMDEIWKLSLDQGNGIVDGAVGPAQVTLFDTAQLWMFSTMGTAASEFMNDQVRAGRAGDQPATAYFEWSAPAGSDLYARPTWWAFHPALGNTITEDALAARTGIATAEWARAYCNLLVDAATEPIIMLETWDELANPPHHVPPLADVTIGIEVAASAVSAAVVAAWTDSDAIPVIRVLHQAAGTAWLRPFLASLRDHHDVCRLAADGAGPVDRIVRDLRQDGWDITTLGFAERGAADDNLLELCADDTEALRHDGSQALRAAITIAQLRTTNGVRRISRDHSLGPVPSLIAASVALWVNTHASPPQSLQIV